MMKKASSRLPLRPIVILFFVVGTLSVLINLPNQENQPAQATPDETTSTTSQKTALILGVDNLAQSDPQLLSIWLASFHFPSKEIILSGLPTNYQSREVTTPLSSLFHWSRETGVDAIFINAIQFTTGVTVDVIIVLDEVGYATLIDFMQGISLAGNDMDGPTVISALRVFYDDPTISLEAQSKVLDALVARVETLGDSPDLTPLFGLLPEHAYASESPSIIAVTFGLLLPLRSEAIRIQQWQLAE